MSCDAKIRPFPAPSVELTCEHDDTMHGEHYATLRDYAYPGSSTILSWQEGDRRNFRGEWSRCVGSCILPAGHQGMHAL